MKKVIVLFVLVLVSAWSFGFSAPVPKPKPANARQVFWQNKVLEAELPLAKSDAVYFVIDVPGSRILFKAKGVVIREWKLAAFRGRALPWPIVSTSLLKKEAKTTPKRKLIDPKNPKTAEEIGSYELDTLESKDMPAEYILTCENELHVHLTSGKEKTLELLAHWKSWLDGEVYARARNLWQMAFKPKSRWFEARIDDPAEARTLCWSFIAGMKGLILLAID